MLNNLLSSFSFKASIILKIVSDLFMVKWKRRNGEWQSVLCQSRYDAHTFVKKVFRGFNVTDVKIEEIKEADIEIPENKEDL